MAVTPLRPATTSCLRRRVECDISRRSDPFRAHGLPRVAKIERLYQRLSLLLVPQRYACRKLPQFWDNFLSSALCNRIATICDAIPAWRRIEPRSCQSIALPKSWSSKSRSIEYEAYYFAGYLHGISSRCRTTGGRTSRRLGSTGPRSCPPRPQLHGPVPEPPRPLHKVVRQ